MVCDRCNQMTVGWKMSWFNTEQICMRCQKEEEAHSDFQDAKEAVRKEESRGNRNYEGVGLPADLRAKYI